MAAPTLAALLQPSFSARQSEGLVGHFQRMTEQFRRGEWERAISYGGKFVEASLKALWLHVGKPLPPARQFKAGKIIQDLKQLPQGTVDDALRVTLPRACEFIYDIASNRGGRHDPDEIDPNEMDATVTVASCSWILGEMLRYSQKGALDPREITRIVAGLTQRLYPSIEEIDDRVYFHLKGISARDVALLTLWHHHPLRLSTEELMAAVCRHGFKRANAHVALQRVRAMVDKDAQDRLRLLQPGLAMAEKLLASSGLRIEHRK